MNKTENKQYLCTRQNQPFLYPCIHNFNASRYVLHCWALSQPTNKCTHTWQKRHWKKLISLHHDTDWLLCASKSVMFFLSLFFPRHRRRFRRIRSKKMALKFRLLSTFHGLPNRKYIVYLCWTLTRMRAKEGWERRERWRTVDSNMHARRMNGGCSNLPY